MLKIIKNILQSIIPANHTTEFAGIVGLSKRLFNSNYHYFLHFQS